MAKQPLPVVILVKPQLGENIGAAARAMSNFRLSELRLVAPRDGWPNVRARETASGGEAVIDAAKIYPDTASAMADIQLAYATTARPRDMEKRVVTPDEAASELRKHSAKNIKTALVFGPERTGLENEDIVLCDTLITIPTDPDHFSLNLAQAAVIVGYEWWKTAAVKKRAAGTVPPAPKEEWTGLFSQLEECLDQADHFRAAHKKPVMWQNLQNMLLRVGWSTQEIRTFRGVLRSLWNRRLGEAESKIKARRRG